MGWEKIAYATGSFILGLICTLVVLMGFVSFSFGLFFGMNTFDLENTGRIVGGLSLFFYPGLFIAFSLQWHGVLRRFCG